MLRQGLSSPECRFLYAILQLPLRSSFRLIWKEKFILLSIAAFGVATILIDSTLNYIMMIVIFPLLGNVSGLFLFPSLTMLSELYKEKKGKTLSLRSGFGSFLGLAPTGLPILALMIGWRNIFILYSFDTAIIFVVESIFIVVSLVLGKLIIDRK
ncbi:MAG: hypothetical protein ACOCTN_01995 [Candidatus Natronoplasma sp.]